MPAKTDIRDRQQGNRVFEGPYHSVSVQEGIDHVTRVNIDDKRPCDGFQGREGRQRVRIHDKQAGRSYPGLSQVFSVESLRVHHSRQVSVYKLAYS